MQFEIIFFIIRKSSNHFFENFENRLLTMVFERGIASAIALLDDDDDERLLLLLLNNEKKTRRVATVWCNYTRINSRGDKKRIL